VEVLLKDLDANEIIVTWIFNKHDGRVVDYIHVAQDRNKLQAIVNSLI
jgi:selenocysteine lyase/cysteine desulfurase